MLQSLKDFECDSDNMNPHLSFKFSHVAHITLIPHMTHASSAGKTFFLCAILLTLIYLNCKSSFKNVRTTKLFCMYVEMFRNLRLVKTFYLKSSRVKADMKPLWKHYFLLLISHLAKCFFWGYSPKCSQPITLQDSSFSKISWTNRWVISIFPCRLKFTCR